MARQMDFGAGELSPLLHAKMGADFYARGAKAVRNLFITKQGAAASRPGTTLVGEVAGSPVDLSGFISLEDSLVDRSILIPFIAADDESFCLVFQPNKIQFITRGGYVVDGGGNRYTIVTPYEEEDLRQLHYAQVGEVLTLVCPNWDAYELRHVSDVPPTWSYGRAVTAPAEIEAFVDPGTSPLTYSTNFNLVDGDGTPDDELPNDGVYSADSDHPAREWTWKVTQLCRELATGRLFETLPEQVTELYAGGALGSAEDYDATHADLPGNKWSVFFDMKIVLRRATPGTLTTPADPALEVVAYNIYRGRGELFGFIGQTDGREFVDDGSEPDYAIQPPMGTNPFGENQEATGAPVPLLSTEDNIAGSVVRRYDRAAAVAYFEQRRVFAGLTRREADLVASKQGDFDNYDTRVLFHITGESLNYTIASRKRGRIRHLVAMDRLVVLTACASYHAGGQPGTPGWDFDSVWIPLIEEVGSNDVTPVVVDGTCFFARAKGRGLRGLASEGNQGGYRGFDACTLAEHLFRGLSRDIVDLTYAEDPWGIIWAARRDGTLLSLTFDREQKMLAWARHDMTVEDDDGNEVVDGLVESVCAVPEDDEDAVYLVVARTIGGVVHRFVERMTSRHERGGTVLDNSGAITTPPDYICVDSAVPFVGAPGTNYTTLTGMGHLEGKTVWVVGEGRTPTEHTVSVGQVALGYTLEPNITDLEQSPGGPRVCVYVGLRYVPELETLPSPSNDRGQMKQVTHVCFEVDNSRGVLVGPDREHLDEAPDRDVQDDFGTQLLRTEVLDVPVRGTWDKDAVAVLRQSLPLPVTVLALSRREARGGP